MMTFKWTHNCLLLALIVGVKSHGLVIVPPSGSWGTDGSADMLPPFEYPAYWKPSADLEGSGAKKLELYCDLKEPHLNSLQKPKTFNTRFRFHFELDEKLKPVNAMFFEGTMGQDFPASNLPASVKRFLELLDPVKVNYVGTQLLSENIEAFKVKPVRCLAKADSDCADVYVVFRWTAKQKTHRYALCLGESCKTYGLNFVRRTVRNTVTKQLSDVTGYGRASCHFIPPNQ